MSCKINNCPNLISGPRYKYCDFHRPSIKRCIEPNCKASARSKSGKCVTHGGGNRCIEPDCKASAQGKTDKCIAHGGGKRCIEPSCQASAAGKSEKCRRHGGGNVVPIVLDGLIQEVVVPNMMDIAQPVSRDYFQEIPVQK